MKRMKNQVSGAVVKSRIDYVDIFRSTGIILMIMGHIGFGKEFNHYIHAFHMPMFFFLTGYFYKEKKLTEIVKSRLNTLIIPYIVIGSFHLTVFFLINRSVDIEQIRIFVWDNTAKNGVAIAGALWFLTAMFFSEIIYNLIQKADSGMIITTFIVVIISVLGMVLSNCLSFRLPWALDVSMVAVGLIHAGRITKEKFPQIFNISLWLSLILFAFFSVTIMFNGYVNIRHGTYGNWILFWINSVGMTIVLWNLSRYICSFLNSTCPLLKNWLTGIGEHSVIYLCFNQIVIKFLNYILGLYLPLESSRSIFFLAVQLTVFIVTLGLLFLLQLLFSKTKLKRLFGKQKL